MFELPNKLHLSRADYLTAQQSYHGWAWLRVAVVGALVSTVVLTLSVRHQGLIFYLTLITSSCIALSLVIFFLFTYPVNQQTLN